MYCTCADEKYFYKCPDRLRLPLIFYLAHTASFYINKMILAGLIKVSVKLQSGQLNPCPPPPPEY